MLETQAALGVVTSRFSCASDWSAAILPAFHLPEGLPHGQELRRASVRGYAVLVVVGVAFAVTACAYGVMTFVSLRAAEAGQNPAALPSSLANFHERPR